MNKENYHKLIAELKNTELIAVTKYSNVEEINEAINLWVTQIGENRIEVMEEKIDKLLPVKKHFIGQIQSKKLKRTIDIFDIIQSVDNIKHLKKIIEISKEKKEVEIFLQINISHEKQKSWLKTSELNEIVEYIKSNNLENTKIIWVMWMAENSENNDDIRTQFRLAKNIFEELKQEITTIKYLSIWMSWDYKIAIEEGWNMVRIGSLIFK